MEVAGQSRYVAQCQALSHPDRDLCQVAGLSDHALADRVGVLAGSQSQHGQSPAGGAVDGSGVSHGHRWRHALGDRRPAYLIHHGLWLYGQHLSEAACRLSIGQAAKADPRLRLMPIGRPQWLPAGFSLQGTRLRTDNPSGKHKCVILSNMVGFIAVPSFLDACEACFSTSLT